MATAFTILKTSKNFYVCTCVYATKPFHESSGHIGTLELKTGNTYRGKLLDAEDNINDKKFLHILSRSISKNLPYPLSIDTQRTHVKAAKSTLAQSDILWWVSLKRVRSKINPFKL